jgi:predicted TIM-barrel fold metal-dependent hydrolase
MIIDCHCHAGEGDGFTGPWDTAAPLGRYLIRARRAGIERAVLFSPFHSDYAQANRVVARIVARAPARFVAFTFVNAKSPASQIAAELHTAITRDGFVGIKVHAHDGRISRAVCEAARRLDVPILYDVMGDIGSVELIAREYPTVAFIIPHLASFADDWRAQRAFIDVLARLPNVHTDTAGVRQFDLLLEALRRAGPTKILFGSDGPWLHPGVELAKIRALDLPPAAERLILGGNLLRLIRAPSAWRTERDDLSPLGGEHGSRSEDRPTATRPHPQIHGAIHDNVGQMVQTR